MVGLTAEDITPEAIQAEEARLHAQTREVRRIQDAIAQLQAQLAHAEEECAARRNSLQWLRLMREVEGDARLSALTAAMARVAAEFRASLTPPSGYDEAAEGIPFADTDDYADVSPVEYFVDEQLEAVRELLAAAPTRRRAMLTLLVLTINVGQLDAELRGAAEVDVAREMEEVKESVTAAWQNALHAAGLLTQAERREWREVLTTYVGAPYDAEQ